MNKPETLYLNLKREYFDAIAEGTKRVEYRDQSEHWKRKLEGRKYDQILFRNGYAPDAPAMIVEFRGLRRYGRGEGAYYAISLGRVLSVKRWKPLRARK